ncbi:MAG: hypothetical protein RLZZ618_680 [Pseudomonadota bacterium]|jgi:hypothetical protein
MPASKPSKEQLAWDRLTALNGGDKITYTDPRLDTPSEVWFFSQNFELRIWHDGVLDRDVPDARTLAGKVQHRVTFYNQLKELFVDVEQRGDRLLVRRGVLNGPWMALQLPASELDELRARYRDLGFKEVTPWNASKNKVTRREYRLASGGNIKAWVVEVDGTTAVIDRKERTAPTREAAVALAEKHIAAKEAKGFSLHLIELMKASHGNPLPTLKGAAKVAPKLLPPIAKPETPIEAVDAAVALLKSMHERMPQTMFVAECLTKADKKSRVEGLGACRTWKASAANRPQRSIFHRLFVP